MNRRKFLALPVPVVIAATLPAFVQPQVQSLEIGKRKIAVACRWSEDHWFDFGHQHATAIEVVLPDGSIVRNAARTHLGSRGTTDVVAATKMEKELLARWFHERFSYQPFLYSGFNNATLQS